MQGKAGQFRGPECALKIRRLLEQEDESNSVHPKYSIWSAVGKFASSGKWSPSSLQFFSDLKLGYGNCSVNSVLPCKCGDQGLESWNLWQGRQDGLLHSSASGGTDRGSLANQIAGPTGISEL